MLDSEEGLFSLFIDNSRELRILMLYFLDHLFLDAFLLLHSILHRGALLEGGSSLTEQLLKHAYLERARLFECHAATTPAMQIEVAVIAEGLIVDATVGRQVCFIITVAHSNFSLGHLEGVLCRLWRLLSTGLCSGCCFYHNCRANTTIYLLQNL